MTGVARYIQEIVTTAAARASSHLRLSRVVQHYLDQTVAVAYLNLVVWLAVRAQTFHPAIGPLQVQLDAAPGAHPVQRSLRPRLRQRRADEDLAAPRLNQHFQDRRRVAKVAIYLEWRVRVVATATSSVTVLAPRTSIRSPRGAMAPSPSAFTRTA